MNPRVAQPDMFEPLVGSVSSDSILMNRFSSSDAF